MLRFATGKTILRVTTACEMTHTPPFFGAVRKIVNRVSSRNGEQTPLSHLGSGARRETAKSGLDMIRPRDQFLVGRKSRGSRGPAREKASSRAYANGRRRPARQRAR